MAYQNVGTPRFYVDWTSYLLNQGIIQGYDNVRITPDDEGSYLPIGMLNPTHQRHWSATGDAIGDTGECGILFKTPNGTVLNMENANWSGVLGHNLGDYDGYSIGTAFRLANNQGYPKLNLTKPIINCDIENNLMKPILSGFSLCEAEGTTNITTQAIITGIYALNRGQQSSNDILKFGSFCFGKYYDMPHSPDLSLKLSFEYDGVKTIQTRGGATLSNATYTKPADWGDNGCWQLGNQTNFRSGRRVWDLSFSYLSESDVFPLNASSGYQAIIGSESGYPDGSIVQVSGATTVNNTTDDSYEFTSSIIDGTDFFSQVWNKTMGGHLPFIFQPDAPKYDSNGAQIGGNNNADQFAICRFDMNSLKYDQIGFNTYNVKLKIREVW